LTLPSVQRQLLIAAAALLAAVIGLAVAARDDRKTQVRPRLPEPALESGGWYEALAGVRTRRLGNRRSACGYALDADAVGVEHPVLPCGAKVYLRFGDKTVLTQVLDRGPAAAGREFDLTPALAELLGLRGVQTIRWTFARA
jgi:rare lipoprotein A (peptidoglycan hydrolase)